MSQPRVITVLLNTSHCEDTLACLASLRANRYENHHVLVLDNASTDGSVRTIKAEFPEVEIIELAENLGYAGNNNVGIRRALEQGADWVFVLNEDTLLAPDGLVKLVEAGEQDLQVGIVGPMVYHYDEPLVIQSAGGYLSRYYDGLHYGQNEVDHGQFSQPRPVTWVSGCAILVRREAIEAQGMLDERFFIYYEETEWCLRLAKAGWVILHTPWARLWHKGVQLDYRPRPSVTYYFTRNRFLMLALQGVSPVIWARVFGRVLLTVVSWTVKPRWRAMRPHRDAMWLGILDFFRRRWGAMPAL